MSLGDRLGNDYRPYTHGVRTFIDFARASANSRGYIKCPYWGCKNLCAIGLAEVESHIFAKGMDLGYTWWVLHGELYAQSADALFSHLNYLWHMDDDYERDEMEEMLNDIGAEMFMDEVDENASSGRGTDFENFAAMWKMQSTSFIQTIQNIPKYRLLCSCFTLSHCVGCWQKK